MRIFCDALITEAKNIFSSFGEVSLIDGRQVLREQLESADILIVRSTCPVNRALLGGTKVRFVGSATIGVDHVDLDYLQSSHIQFAHAPGCNAIAVSEYVASTLAQIDKANGKGKEAAVIGFGNVGQKVALMLERLGFEVFVNDPPRQDAGRGSPYGYCSLQRALQCDVICAHTPLVQGGKWPTIKLLNRDNLTRLNDHSVLINAGRGEVIDNRCLSEIIHQKKLSVILDVFEGEPSALADVIQKAKRVSPHIAGHSLEGKLRGSFMIAESLANFLNMQFDQKMIDYLPKSATHRQPMSLADAVPLEKEDRALRNFADIAIGQESETIDPALFDELRKNYTMRREFQYLPLEITS